jgi:hypothetical protein
MKSKLPTISRSFVRGFVVGLVVMALAAAGLVLGLAPILSSGPDPLMTWPAVLKADDTRYLGVEAGNYQITTTQPARDLAAAYANTWANRGWDVTTHVDMSQAVITATHGLASYTLRIQAENGVARLVTTGWQGPQH